MYYNDRSARTINQVEQSLKALSLGMDKTTTSNYLQCRYDPFHTKMSGTKVPDGLGRNLTTRDYLGTYDIVTANTGDTEIMILPTLPMQIAVRPATASATCLVNGAGVKNSPIAVGGPNPWTPFSGSGMSIFNSTQAGTNTNYIGAARMVTVAYRLYYTGPATTCQGIIQADIQPINQDEGPLMNTTPVLFQDSVGTNPYSQVNTKYIVVDLPDSVNLSNKNSVICRPEAGLQGVLIRAVPAEAHLFKAYHETGLALIGKDYSSTAEKVGPLYSYFTDNQLPSGFNYGFISMLDHDFNVTKLRISANDARYRLEIITCAQFEQQLDFPLISITTMAGPRDSKMLAIDDKLNESLPPGMSLGSAFFPNQTGRRVRRNRPNNPNRNANRNIQQLPQRKSAKKGNNRSSGRRKSKKGNKPNP